MHNAVRNKYDLVMFRKGIGLKAVRIDAVLAIAWFLVFWISILYAFTHRLWWL